MWCDVMRSAKRGRKFLGVRAVANPSGNTKFPRPRVRGSAPRPYGDHPSTSPRQTNKQTNKQTDTDRFPSRGIEVLSGGCLVWVWWVCVWVWVSCLGLLGLCLGLVCLVCLVCLGLGLVSPWWVRVWWVWCLVWVCWVWVSCLGLVGLVGLVCLGLGVLSGSGCLVWVWVGASACVWVSVSGSGGSGCALSKPLPSYRPDGVERMLEVIRSDPLTGDRGARERGLGRGSGVGETGLRFLGEIESTLL
jgi:hypothetical protein